MCRETLDLNLSVPTHPHHLGKAARIVAVGFGGAHGQGSMGMAGIHADHRETAFKECHSHGDVGPLSNPTLAARGAWVWMKAIKAAGSDGTSASIKTRPETFRTQTAVFWSETSNAT